MPAIEDEHRWPVQPPVTAIGIGQVEARSGGPYLKRVLFEARRRRLASGIGRHRDGHHHEHSSHHAVHLPYGVYLPFSDQS